MKPALVPPAQASEAAPKREDVEPLADLLRRVNAEWDAEFRKDGSPKRRARKPHVLGRVVVLAPGTRALLRMAQAEGRTVVATYEGGMLTLTVEHR